MAGYINDSKELPVNIQLDYYKTKEDGKYIVYWYAPGRYADFQLMEEYVKKRFPNCKVFTDSANLFNTTKAFSR